MGQAGSRLRSMFDLALHYLAKLSLTGVLVLVIVVSAIQIHRLWFDRTLVLAPFRYIGAKDTGEAQGRYFTELVGLHLAELRDLFADEKRGAGAARGPMIPSTDLAGRGRELDLPMLSSSPFSSITIEAYGVQVSTLLRSLWRWIERPYSIEGTVFEITDGLRVTARLSGRPGTGEPMRWELQDRTPDGASANLACRMFFMVLGRQSPALIKETSVDEFCAFVRAWRSYRTYANYFAGVGQQKEAEDALKVAAELIGGLIGRNSRFPFTYKLATIIDRDQGKIADSRGWLERYRQLLASAKLSDPDLAALETAPAPPMPSPTAAVVGRSAAELGLTKTLRPIPPGASISSELVTAGTVCCPVRDGEGRLFLLTAEHAVNGKPGDAVYQPGRADGGDATMRIGEIAKVRPPQLGVANTAAGALVGLAPDVGATLTAPGLGPIRGVAGLPQVGDRVRSLGRTSGLVDGRVTALQVSVSIAVSATETARFVGMIETSPISAPGDSGAPVVNERDELIGFVYGGSAAATIVMPIPPVLETLGVRLEDDPS